MANFHTRNKSATDKISKQNKCIVLLPSDVKVHQTLYTDDTGIYASAHHSYTLYRRLQAHIDSFINFCNLRRVRINGSKTFAVYFSRKTKYPNRLTINKTIINWSNSAKYLGAILDPRLTWKKYFLSIRCKVAGTSETLKSLFNSFTHGI